MEVIGLYVVIRLLLQVVLRLFLRGSTPFPVAPSFLKVLNLGLGWSRGTVGCSRIVFGTWASLRDREPYKQ